MRIDAKCCRNYWLFTIIQKLTLLTSLWIFVKSGVGVGEVISRGGSFDTTVWDIFALFLVESEQILK